MKVRIIPIILTNGNTVVKGTKFDNWRTVGSAAATAGLYANRDVDELVLLDVKARESKRTLDLDLLREFSRLLDVPFTVGGGIDTIEHARSYLRAGAEKIVLGTSALLNPMLISQIAETFGSQAVAVSLDFKCTGDQSLTVNSGKKSLKVDPDEFVSKLEERGAGEVLLQTVELDGTMLGPDLSRITRISSLTNLPIVANSGIGKLEDFYNVIQAGATAVGAGAIFQFTEITPRIVGDYLHNKGIQVRKLV